MTHHGPPLLCLGASSRRRNRRTKVEDSGGRVCASNGCQGQMEDARRTLALAPFLMFEKHFEEDKDTLSRHSVGYELKRILLWLAMRLRKQIGLSFIKVEDTMTRLDSRSCN